MHSDIQPRSAEPERLSILAEPTSRAAILRDVIGHGDIATRCELGFLDNGFRCARTAVAYVEFHMVGHCKRFDCDAHGNACGFVCAEHRDALEYTAQCVVAEMEPTGLRRLFNRVARCPTCGRTLLGESDVLQVVVSV